MTGEGWTPPLFPSEGSYPPNVPSFVNWSVVVVPLHTNNERGKMSTPCLPNLLHGFQWVEHPSSHPEVWVVLDTIVQSEGSGGEKGGVRGRVGGTVKEKTIRET